MAKNGTVGIGYSRRSLVYGRADASSVERQDEVLEATIRADGLSPRLFSDASGHRSGRNATNRPEYRNAIALIPHPDTKCIYFDLLDRAWRNVEEWNRSRHFAGHPRDANCAATSATAPSRFERRGNRPAAQP